MLDDDMALVVDDGGIGDQLLFVVEDQFSGLEFNMGCVVGDRGEAVRVDNPGPDGWRG
jgi:hypothetical protein